MPEYKKKVSDGVGFAMKTEYEYDGKKFEADLKDGDIVKLLNAGVEEEGKWGAQTNFKIKTRNGEKKTAFNQSTINVLVEEFGSEGEGWIGKDLNVILQKKLINGKKSIVAYFVPAGYELDEYGALVKLCQQTSQEDRDSQRAEDEQDGDDVMGDTAKVIF